LRSAALTVTEPKIRGALTDIPRLFTDKDFSKAAVAKSDHWAVKDFWNNQMANTADFHKSEMLNYFTSKFGSFLGNNVMHQILSQRTSAFDMRTLMDRRKILLVNLSKGKLGSLNAQLLGALMVAKIQMAAMSRADVPAENRPPFYVYIDEFQNVVTDSFAQMLSEVRKYGVGLHLAHQYVDQLPESIKQAVSGNVGTLMAFRLGHADAQWLAPHFAPLTSDDLTSIPPYHYHLRTLAHGQLTTPFTVAAPNITTTPQPALELALRNRVRQFVAASHAAG
jgi:type IV secretory pathway TraG/TraD family ATPase VirD4